MSSIIPLSKYYGNGWDASSVTESLNSNNTFLQTFRSIIGMRGTIVISTIKYSC